MALRSCLDERPAPVVADTSVVINLNATGCSEAILGALPNRCVVPEDVSLEFQAGRRTGRGDAAALAALVEQHLFEPARLGDVGMSHFAGLVGGAAADTLDDGEAATIACAVERSAIALIDDRKAIRICAEHRRSRAPAVLGAASEQLVSSPGNEALSPARLKKRG
ncbi:MAG: hypothetical protein OXF93_14365 [Acidobacteria bacterium]|nr:hypothetical protein [Acidobacteriota bacterium]